VTDNSKLTVADISTPDQYQRQRPAVRRAMIDYKKNRRVALGPHVTLHFEDMMTMRYQVQEMVYAENLRGDDAIEQELAAYNPLIPDGTNLKCTLMIEVSDPDQRHQILRDLLALEQHVGIQVDGHEPVMASANNDSAESAPSKTSAVHFLCFEFQPAMIDALFKGASCSLFSNHPAYRCRVDPLPDSVSHALSQDFTPTKAH